MAQKIKVGGKMISRPGVYSTVKSGIKSNPTGLDYGHVVIIDDGIGAEWGGGPGGTVQDFEKVEDFQEFVKGGELWNIAAPLFKPGTGYNGISKLSLIHARETTPATISYAMTNGTLLFTSKDEGVNANGQLSGTILSKGYAAKFVSNAPTVASTYTSALITAAATAVKEKRSLTILNPIVGDIFSVVFGTESVTISYTATTNNQLSTLNAILAALKANATLAAAYTFAIETVNGVVVITAENKVVNTTFTLTPTVVHPAPKAKVQIFAGSFKGTDPLNNAPYDNVDASLATPSLIAESPFYATIQEFINWGTSDASVTGGWVVTGTVTDNANGLLQEVDITSNDELQLAAGGMEIYTPNALADARLKVKQLSNSFFLATKYGANATDAENVALVDLAKSGSRYQRFVFVGGGATAAEYHTISKPAAAYFNAEEAIVVHGDGLKLVGLNKSKRVSSFYKAAAVLGRLSGLEVQTPITWKQIDIDSEYDPIDEDLFEDANDAGVLVTYKDNELGFTIVQLGINTLQNNENVVNEDGTSYSIQVARMKAQLNKELAIFLKKKFFSNQTSGPNRNTVSVQELESATDGFLQDKHASTNKDNYLLSHRDIVASVQGVAYKVDYKFTPNFEVDFIIPTGTIIENN